MTMPNQTVPRAGPTDRILTTYEHELPPKHGDYRWVFLWHRPVRITHWVAVIAVTILFFTGFYIARPVVMANARTTTFVLQYVRLAHFLAAAAFVAAGLVRVYWFFVGGKFERWGAMFPIHWRHWKNMWRMIRYYLFIHPEETPHYLGHNPLQRIVHTVTYGIGAIMALTGFVLFGQANPGGMTHTAFGWMAPLFGGMQMVRTIHHVLSWYFPTFVILHVYLSIRSDLLERNGAVSAMLTGGRFVRADRDYVDE